jgi:hypothetical protein
LRWVFHALRTNRAIWDSLTYAAAEAGSAGLVDSQTMLINPKSRYAGAHIILWDGFNSYIELAKMWPTLIARCRLLVVGRIYDQQAAYPPETLPLFADVVSPLDSTSSDLRGRAYRTAVVAAAIRSRLRWTRNAVLDFRRHQRLCGHRLIVFCGLLRPPEGVLIDFARGAEDEPLLRACSGLSSCDLSDRVSVYSLVASVYRAIERYVNSGASTAAKTGCAYALLNTLHRIGIIATIMNRDPGIFLSEYGKNPHIDPYDTPYYRHHLYLDFGSSRGPDAVYPRSIDLIRNRKNYIPLRFISTKESFINYLASTSAARFIELCERQSELVLARYHGQSADHS